MRAGWRLARRAIAYEARMWTDLFRWILRRPVCGDGETPFRYARTMTPILGGFIAASAIEVPALHVLVPWQTVRIVVDALGVYALLWMVGMLASHRTRPHVVTPDGLRVRGAGGLDATVPWGYIRSVRAVDRNVDGRRSVGVDRAADGPTLYIAVMNRTNVDVTFRGPTIVELPTGDTEPLHGVRIAADEPAALVAAVREHLRPDGAARSSGVGRVTDQR